jgi:hypothetical protein
MMSFFDGKLGFKSIFSCCFGNNFVDDDAPATPNSRNSAIPLGARAALETTTTTTGEAAAAARHTNRNARQATSQSPSTS